MAEANLYPGEQAAPDEIFRLAREYRQAASVLRDQARRNDPLSWAPFRLVALHAIELYLNALLLHRGHGPEKVRGLQHDMCERAAMAADAGMVMRDRTRGHLNRICAGRKYLAVRYAADRPVVGPDNRMISTLDEVARKVERLIVAPVREPGFSSSRT